MQKRLRKYGRGPETLAAVASRQITETSLKLIATIHDYRIIPTSLLIRLVEGHEKNLQRQLQNLYHKRLINRFAFPGGKNLSEFHYYLDDREALNLLLAHGVERASLQFEEVQRNREKRYCDVNDPKLARQTAGRLLFLEHEAMISRFHAMLELACKESNGQVELVDFQQGPTLWNNIEVPKVIYRDGQWRELDDKERLPHRPDAFFTLSFPNDQSREPMHFFYEADRHRTNTNRFNKKLRAHFHFAVKQKERLRQSYGLNRIRAVLTETVDDEWAERLRFAANHFVVSGPKPSPLFWFTTSRLFTQEAADPRDRNSRVQPAYLRKPEMVFQKIWASPVNNVLHSIID